MAVHTTATACFHKCKEEPRDTIVSLADWLDFRQTRVVCQQALLESCTMAFRRRTMPDVRLVYLGTEKYCAV